MAAAVPSLSAAAISESVEPAAQLSATYTVFPSRRTPSGQSPADQTTALSTTSP